MDHGRFIAGIGPCLWFVVVSPAFAATIEFQTLPPLELSKSSPSDHVIADFNNDTHLDLVVVMSGSGGGDGGVSVLLGDGNGGFSNHDFPTGTYNAWGVATGDFNRDNHPDLALTTTVTSAGLASRDIHILLGDGVGGFTAHTTVQALQDAPHAVTVGDFNEDGIPDLVIGTTQTTSFHAGAADATFGAGQLLSGSNNLSGDQLFSADFNADGHLDVGSRQAVYLGAGDGSFTRSAFFNVGAKASADLNGDGHADLISAAGNNVQIWFGMGDGSFTLNSTVTVGTDLNAATVDDFDGDSHPDVALVSAGDTTVIVLLNNGDGSLAAPQAFATGPQPRMIAAADWNEDGLMDMVVPYSNMGDTPYATRLMQVLQAPSPGQLQFDASTFSVSEDAGTATIPVTRSGGVSGPVTVSYSTADDTATAGVDYAASSGVLTFADGEILKTFTVPILDDAEYEGDERIQLHLDAPTGGAALGALRDATLIIRENDTPPPAGSVQLDGNSYAISEGDGMVNITVTRAGGSAGDIGIDYATRDASARAGEDYIASNGSLLLGNGVTTATIDLHIVDDTTHEAAEYFIVTLSNPTGGALGQPDAVEIAILDNDPQPAPAISTRNGGRGVVDFLFAALLLAALARHRFAVVGSGRA